MPASCWVYRGQHRVSSDRENLSVVLPNVERFKAEHKTNQVALDWKVKLTWLRWYKKNANAWRRRAVLVPRQDVALVRLLFLQTQNYKFYVNCELGHFLQLVDVGPLKYIMRYVKGGQLRVQNGFLGQDLEQALKSARHVPQ